jgi:hypothetical protein
VPAESNSSKTYQQMPSASAVGTEEQLELYFGHLKIERLDRDEKRSSGEISVEIERGALWFRELAKESKESHTDTRSVVGRGKRPSMLRLIIWRRFALARSHQQEFLSAYVRRCHS